MAWLAASGAANAEISKVTVPTDSAPQVYWWPVLPVPQGWVRDDEESRARGVNVIRPAATSFEDAPAVIYARADSKPRFPQIHSLADYMRLDEADIRAQSPSADIVHLPDVKTGDGAVLKVVSHALPQRRQWELVAYGEEGDFYVLFTVSGSTEADLKAHEGVFYALLAKYKKQP
jgi:hypothetical protein